MSIYIIDIMMKSGDNNSKHTLINHDLLFVMQNMQFSKQLEPDEAVILSTQIYKFNDYKKRQYRGLVVTTKHLINLKNLSIKRKIPLIKIKAITISTTGAEFVLHVPEEYDYRFFSLENRNAIVSSILKGVCATTKEKMPIFFKEDMDLFNYATTKRDKKKRISRLPNDQPQLMDEQNFKQILESKDSSKVVKKYHSLYQRDRTKEVDYDDFLILKVLYTTDVGKTMLVEHRETGEWFCLKAIRNDQLDMQHEEVQSMMEEYSIKPFVEVLCFAFCSKHKFFFFTTFTKGGEFQKLMQEEGTFDEKKTKFYAACLTLALGALHHSNIVYKNLNPHAILVDDIGFISLQDFNQGRFKFNTTTKNKDYLAPEIQADDAPFTKAGDWWSLGVLIYEWLFGVKPHYDQFLTFPHSNVSHQAKNILLQLLNKQPEERLCSQKGVTEILTHPWFKDVNWDAFLKKQIQVNDKQQI